MAPSKRTSRSSLPTFPISSFSLQQKQSKATSNTKRRVETFLNDANMSTPDNNGTSRKRRRVTNHDATSPANSKTTPILLCDDDEDHITPSKKTSSSAKSKKDPAEKRLRRYRAKPPQTFLAKLSRAQTQRMIVLSRTRTSAVSEDIAIVGSTGNIYTVTIGHLPSCTCPDHGKGNECKHKVYALHTVLRAPDHLVYQLALVTEELESVFAAAPPIPTDTVSDDDKDTATSKRKPIEDGSECPICYMDMLGTEELVWCKAACGNNMHKNCFDQWAASQRGQTVKCVYCRTPWEVDASDLAKMKTQGSVGPDGYVNVAEQFGLSGQRDYSSYNSYWVRRQFGVGY